METVVLVVLLILALALIGVVLLQRNEGGGLGMGSAGVMTGRGQATALARATWLIGGAFMAASLLLTVIAAQDAGGASVVDRINAAPAEDGTGDATIPGLGEGDLLPPPAAGDAPLVPLDDAPVAPGTE